MQELAQVIAYADRGGQFRQWYVVNVKPPQIGHQTQAVLQHVRHMRTTLADVRTNSQHTNRYSETCLGQSLEPMTTLRPNCTKHTTISKGEPHCL